MMLVTSLFTSLTGGAAAAGATAATGAAAFGLPAAAAAGTAAAGSSALTLLQGGATAFSALASIGAGRAQARELEAQAEMERFRARDEFIAGEEQAAKLKTELAATISNQAVAFAAGGVDLGSYSVGRARGQAIDDAERELATSGNAALSRGLTRRLSARSMMQRAQSARIAGFVDAAEGIGGFASQVAARG